MLRCAKQLLVLLILCMAVVAHAQRDDRKVKLERQKIRLQDEIELANKILLETRNTKKVSLTNVETVEQKLRLRQNLINTLDRETEILNRESAKLQKDIDNMKIQWRTEAAFSVISQLYKDIKVSDEYKNYMNSGADSFNEDKNFLVTIFRNFVVNNELLHEVLEDSSIFWNDDLDIVALSAIKTLESIGDNDAGFEALVPLFKDEDDEKFAKTLFRNTILKQDECEKLIKGQTKNWDIDRLAKTDVILMNMAIIEALDFPSIPVKVTMNEYIEISKFYSTPKSKGFINGILDKIFSQLKADGKINKTGRGLISKSLPK